jgi:hypothetical protein
VRVPYQFSRIAGRIVESASGLDRTYQNASGPPEVAASMLRKLAGGLPTGEYSRRYPGPNCGDRADHAATT